ncbi:MAG: Unknown protein [uncultured Sulfurovum sp.]|uniref:Prepilin-type N-terminal cleavage/methylation domain-containing protein n=1 Tax=uncultured Sulfurovum sp. TaxID=269237 RepID=A0A6S6TVP9_9BACT|nr:MAG: Unknown protein [uncultured Sulfurovum sp.]
MKKAFTLLEMTFVIVILGIIAGISSEVIAKTYEAYINQRALYRSSIKTELAITQITNRLAYAIPGSVVARDTSDDSLSDISSIDSNNTFDTLQWIGYDRDSFIARSGPGDLATNRRPGWTGFCDLTASGRVAGPTSNIGISTPGSNLNLANTIIGNLSTGGTACSLASAAVYFPVDALNIHNNADAYTVAGNPGIFNTNDDGTDDENLSIAAPNTNISIKEQYKLAWTSYAIVATDEDGNGGTDLVLRYNFQPWRGAAGGFYNDAATTAGQKVLIRDISVFRFTGTENVVRLKICKPERISADESISVCKEKAVIR